MARSIPTLTNMKNKIIQTVLFVSLVALAFSCQNKHIQEGNLTGDLYYTWLPLGSLYGLPDSIAQKYSEKRDTILSDSSGAQQWLALEQHDLLHSPYIYLKADSTIYTVYMPTEQYQAFTKFSHAELIEREEKVRISLNAEAIAQGMYLCKEVVNVEVVAGQTMAQEKKFRIEDYK